MNFASLGVDDPVGHRLDTHGEQMGCRSTCNQVDLKTGQLSPRYIQREKEWHLEFLPLQLLPSYMVVVKFITHKSRRPGPDSNFPINERSELGTTV